MPTTTAAGEKDPFDAQSEIRKLRKAVKKLNKDQGKVMFIAVYALILAFLVLVSVSPKRKG